MPSSPGRWVWQEDPGELPRAGGPEHPPQRRVAIAVAGKDFELDRCWATAVFVASACTIEGKPREPRGGKLARNGGLDARTVEWLANLDDMDSAVGMQIAPAQHCRLKQVEPTAHERRWAKARVLPPGGSVAAPAASVGVQSSCGANRPLRFDAPMLLHAEPDVRCMKQI